MFNQQQLEDIVDLLIEVNSPDTKIYIGTDSVRVRREGRWFAKYATVCVIHKAGKNGCKVFVHKSEEPDFDLKKNRPKMRMMNEVDKSCQLYLQLAPLIDGFSCEIHCDINLDNKFGSNCAAKEAAGYVLGSTGLEAIMKPFALASSFAADHWAN